MPFNRSPSRRALRSPSGVRGKSVRPVCWPERVHAVFPCRAIYTTGSASFMPSLLLLETVHSQFHMLARRTLTPHAPSHVLVTRPWQVTGASPTRRLPLARLLLMIQLGVPT